jgi:hypothetical protein
MLCCSRGSAWQVALALHDVAQFVAGAAGTDSFYCNSEGSFHDLDGFAGLKVIVFFVIFFAMGNPPLEFIEKYHVMFGSLQISKSKNFVLKSHKTTWTTTCFF